MLSQDSGCKVGWEYWETRAEAEAASKRAQAEAERKWKLGYDFGYCVPGEITPMVHKTHGACWRVTVP